MKVLVTGGAGYIGSHTAKEMARAGHEVFVYDDLSRGNRWAVKWGPLVEGNLLDEERLTQALETNRVTAVLHFAALAYVGESMQRPADYFRNNVQGTLALLRAMKRAGVNTLVFSSSCAVFGNPEVLPVAEDCTQNPVSPYGESKRIVEQILRWHGECEGLRWVALRYFNAAGADSDGEIGEYHRPETHAIPLVLQAASKDAVPFSIFGAGHETPDGTCVRDYVHVTDLADAHRRALDYLCAGGESTAFNLGTGRGYSVREIVEMVGEVAGRRPVTVQAPPRPGDPASVIASNARAMSTLGWRPKHSSLEKIVSTAWQWHCSMPVPGA